MSRGSSMKRNKSITKSRSCIITENSSMMRRSNLLKMLSCSVTPSRLQYLRKKSRSTIDPSFINVSSCDFNTTEDQTDKGNYSSHVIEVLSDYGAREKESKEDSLPLSNNLSTVALSAIIQPSGLCSQLTGSALSVTSLSQ